MRGVMTVAAAMLVVGLAGCGTDGPTNEDGDMESKVKLTEAVTEYEAFNDDLTSRLDAEFGAKPWQLATDTEMTALCDDGGKRQFLAMREFPGSYDAATLAKVRDVVLAVGKDHGFAEPSLLLEKPGYLEVVAGNETGGEYSFVASKKTSLVTSTGCHPVD